MGRRRALGAVLGAIAAAVVVLLSAQPALGAPQPVTFSAPINLPAGTNPFSVAVGDFNEDAKPDLAVTNSGSNNVSLLLANGSGGFTGPTNFPVGTEPLHVAVGDFNGDGKVDLAVVNSGSNNVWVLLGDGSGGFTGPTNFFARSPSANAHNMGELN